jgi:hypothetical protein
MMKKGMSAFSSDGLFWVYSKAFEGHPHPWPQGGPGVSKLHILMVNSLAHQFFLPQGCKGNVRFGLGLKPVDFQTKYYL